MKSTTDMWEDLYQRTGKMPVVPMYGLFPVKLKTHVGAPIYPRTGGEEGWQSSAQGWSRRSWSS